MSQNNPSSPNRPPATSSTEPHTLPPLAFRPWWRESVADLLPGARLSRQQLSSAKLNTLGEKYYENERQQANQRRLCEWAAHHLEHAGSLVNALVDYVHGEGLRIEVEHPRAGVTAIARAYLDAFEHKNSMSLRIPTLIRNAIVTGEVFLRFLPDGMVPRLRFVPPEYIVSPQPVILPRKGRAVSGPHGSEEQNVPQARYGMVFHPEDHEQVLAYCYDDGQQKATFRAEEVFHLKFVDDPFLYPRGVGFFWRVLDDLIDLHNLATTVLRSAGKRAAFFMVQHLPASSGDLTRMGGEPLEVAPGAYILQVHEDVKVSYPMDNLHWEGIRDWYRQKLQDVAAALGVPVHTLTKNMESQNRSNTEVSEREGLRTMARHQAFFFEQLRRMYLWVLAEGIATGAVPARLDEFTLRVEGSPLHTPHRAELVSELLELRDRGLITDEVVLRRLGYGG